MKQKTKLTWKYFIQQKSYEISKALGIFILIFGVPILLAIYYPIALLCMDIDGCGENLSFIVIDTILYALVIYVFLGITYAIFVFLIYEWLKSNWEKAEKRAIKKLKQKEEKNDE